MNWIVNESKRKASQTRKTTEGGVVTKAGNYYTPQDWLDMQAAFEAEAAETDDYFEQQAIITEAALDMLYKTGQFDDVPRPNLRHALDNTHKVQFSSAEKAEAARPIFDWYNKQY
jgi:hypothetical protein